MPKTPSEHFTQLVNQAAQGDARAADQVLPLVIDELRRLAQSRLHRLPPGQTLQPTALVNEVWVRLAESAQGPWQGRRHFYFVAARAMRDILVEDARRKGASKRGGKRQRVELLDQLVVVEAPVDDMIALDLALRRLESVDADGARLVMLRFFVGLSHEEIAELLETSLSTVERKWRFARAWLRAQLEAGA